MGTCRRASRRSPGRTITTCTDARAALLSVERRGAGHAVGGLRRGERLAPRVLEVRPDAVHACLLPTQAGPLAGDHDRVRIVVGAGATLVVRPVAATLALPGVRRIRLDLEVEVGRAGRLVLEEAPLILAAGAHIERSAAVRLAAGAVAALRDTLVLGRAGEAGGRLVSTMRITDEQGLVLHDAMRHEPATARRDAHVAFAPGHRVAATLCLLGIELPDDAPFALARAGALRRFTARGLAELDAELTQPWQRWMHTITSRP